MLARGTFRPVFVPKATQPMRRAAARVLRIALTGAVAFTMSADVGQFVLDGQSAELYTNHHLNGEPGAFVLDGQAAEPVTARTMAADVGALAVDGQPATLRFELAQRVGKQTIFRPVSVRSVSPASVAGPQFLRAQFTVEPTAYTMPSNVGAFVLDGRPAELVVLSGQPFVARGTIRPVFVPQRSPATIRAPRIIRAPSTGQGVSYTLAGDVGAFALDGQPAAFVVARYMVSDVGAFVLDGQPADLRQFKGLIGDVGAFVLDGQPATFAVARRMASDLGAFAVDGQPATLNVGRRMAADVGGFVLTGQDATSRRGRNLSSDVGAFVLAGQDAALVVGTLVGVRLRGRDLSGPLLASRDTSESYW